MIFPKNLFKGWSIGSLHPTTLVTAFTILALYAYAVHIYYPCPVCLCRTHLLSLPCMLMPYTFTVLALYAYAVHIYYPCPVCLCRTHACRILLQLEIMRTCVKKTEYGLVISTSFCQRCSVQTVASFSVFVYLWEFSVRFERVQV